MEQTILVRLDKKEDLVDGAIYYIWAGNSCVATVHEKHYLQQVVQ